MSWDLAGRTSEPNQADPPVDLFTLTGMRWDVSGSCCQVVSWLSSVLLWAERLAELHEGLDELRETLLKKCRLGLGLGKGEEV